MCELIDQCCSEDETDNEVEQVDASKKVFKVKKLPWRNARLEALILRLEAYDEEKKKVSPKNTPGAKPRNRIRDSLEALISNSKTPCGLPSDCYDPEWLANLRTNHPDQYEELQVDPTTVLDDLERKAYVCLRI